MYIRSDYFKNIVNSEEVFHYYAEKMASNKWRLVCVTQTNTKAFLSDEFAEKEEIDIRIDKIWEAMKHGVEFFELD